MKRIFVLLCGAALMCACSREPETLKVPTGSDMSATARIKGNAIPRRLKSGCGNSS